MRSMQEAFPVPPRLTLRRVLGSGRLWVIEGVNDYDGDIWNIALIWELDEQGLIVRTRATTRRGPSLPSGVPSGSSPSSEPGSSTPEEPTAVPRVLLEPSATFEAIGAHGRQCQPPHSEPRPRSPPGATFRRDGGDLTRCGPGRASFGWGTATVIKRDCALGL